MPQAILLVLLGLVSACAAGDPGLRRAHEREISALRTADLRRLAEAFTEDAVISLPGGNAIAGRPAIVAHYERAFAGRRSDPKTVVVDVVVSGDWALERFRFETRIEPRDGSTPSLVKGHGVHVYRRDANGVWRIAYDTFETLDSGIETRRGSP